MSEMRCNRCHRPMAGTTAYDGACACGGLIEAAPEPEFPPPDFLGSPTSFTEAEVIERGVRIDHEYRRLCGYAVEASGRDLLDVAMRPILHTLQAWLTEQHRISRGLDPKTGERTSERRRQDERAARAEREAADAGD